MRKIAPRKPSSLRLLGELALQVANEIISFKGKKRLVVAAVYGGANMREQLRVDLQKRRTHCSRNPGRIMDHIRAAGRST